MDILIDGKTGEMEFAVIKYGEIVNGAEVPPDHPIRQALSIGQKVMGVVPEGWRLVRYGELYQGEHYVDTNVRDVVQSVATPAAASLFIVVESIEPAPLKGLEWLESLAWGTQRWNNVTSSGGVFTVMQDGLHWHHSGDIWKWDGTQSHENQSNWHGVRWVREACPETCPKWKPTVPSS